MASYSEDRRRSLAQVGSKSLGQWRRELCLDICRLLLSLPRREGNGKSCGTFDTDNMNLPEKLHCPTLLIYSVQYVTFHATAKGKMRLRACHSFLALKQGVVDTCHANVSGDLLAVNSLGLSVLDNFARNGLRVAVLAGASDGFRLGLKYLRLGLVEAATVEYRVYKFSQPRKKARNARQ